MQEGPEASLSEMRSIHVPSAYLQHHPVFAQRAEGAWIEDVSGNKYLDLAGGIGVLNVGHRHPFVMEALEEQMTRLLHTGPVTLHAGYVQLAAQIARLMTNGQDKQVLFVNSGAEAVENAVKIARHATNRPAVIAFDRSFHGRTFLTSTLTGKTDPYKMQPGALAPDVYHSPFPYPFRPPLGVRPDELLAFCIASLDDLVAFRVPQDKVAAVIVEPVQGEGGYIVPPVGFLTALRAWCQSRGILLIVDEIQTGYGRTGRMFASEYESIEPDILVLGKSIAGGLPLACVVASSTILELVHPGDIGGTYGGNPLSCAAGLAVLRVFAEEHLIERAATIATRIRSVLEELSARADWIGEVRGLGTMLAVELVEDRATKTPAPKRAQAVVEAARAHGLLLIKAGVSNNVVRFLPPLTISDDELDTAETGIREAFALGNA